MDDFNSLYPALYAVAWRVFSSIYSARCSVYDICLSIMKNDDRLLTLAYVMLRSLDGATLVGRKYDHFGAICARNSAVAERRRHVGLYLCKCNGVAPVRLHG